VADINLNGDAETRSQFCLRWSYPQGVDKGGDIMPLIYYGYNKKYI